jgi:PAS domain S-box-containing protein
MSDPIRILVVEDLKTDFELAQREIRRSLPDCTFRQVETREGFLDALGDFQPDLILSDFSLPRFDGMKALELALEHAPLTPFIIWTGSMGEDTAVECMKAGAVNYIIKENIKRLGPAVVHALEERQVLMARKQAELRYQAIFEQSHDAIFIMDLKGFILAVNRRASDMLGYLPDELPGLSVNEISAEVQQSENILKRLAAGELIPAYERLFRKKDGSFVPVEVNVELVYDARGNPAHLQSIVRNITERKRAETEIRRRNDDLGLLNAINEAVIRGESLDAVVTLLGKEMKRIFNTVGSTVYMLSSDNQYVTLRQYYMLPELTRKIEQLIGSTIPLIRIPIREGGYFQKSLNSRGGRITSDPQEIQGWLGEFVETTFLSPAARSAIRKLIPTLHKLLGIRSVISIPLVSDWQTIGLLDISGPNLFTQDDLERIEYISRQLTTAIQRQQANERIQRSEEFLQSVQNALSASIAILDETGTIVRVNSAWRKFGEQNGFAHLEYGVGFNYLDVCDSARGPDADEAHAVAAAIREVIAGTREEARFEYSSHSPAEKRWFVLRITKFEDMDQTWVVTAHENITERNQAEQALLESEQRYHELFENSPVAIWEEDFSELKRHLDSLKQQDVQDFRSYFQSHPEEVIACAGMIRVNDVNTAALRLYEAGSKQELIEETMRVLSQGEQEHNLEDFAAIAENRTGNSWEGSDETLPGRPIEISLTWSVAPGYEHDYSKVIVTTVDITERKRMEHERLERLKEMTCLYAVRHDMGLELSVDELCGRIVEHLIRAMQFPEITVPVIELDGRRYTSDSYRDDLSNFLSAEIVMRGKPYGNLLVYYTEDKPFILPEEQDLVRSIADDLRLWLERRQAEEALRESEERFRSLFDRMLDGIYRSTHEGRFVDINPAMVRMFGYSSREEMLAVDIKSELYFSPEERGSHLLDTGQEEVDVYRMRRKDGSEIWVEDRGSYVHDEQGNIIYHEGILRDVTQRKKDEFALQESRSRYQSLFENSPISLWEEDFSQVKSYFDNLRHSGVTDFQEYFDSHPEAVRECAGLVKVLDVNRATLDLMRMDDKTELLGSLTASLSEEAFPSFKAELVNLAEGTLSYEADEDFRVKTGEKRNVLFNLTVAPGYAETLGRVLVSIMDITDRKQAESELKRSNSLLNATLEATKDGILVVGRDRRISSFNRKFLELWKIPYSLAMKMDDRILQEFVQGQLKDPQGFAARVEELYRVPYADSFDELEFKDGRILERHSQPQRLGSAVVGRVWSFRDITERKRAEQELRNSEERFRQLADNIQEMFWMTDVVNNREEYLSPAFRDIWGFPPERMMQGEFSFLDTVLPEDRPFVASILERQRQGEQTEIEYRITRPDGAVRWIWDRAFPIFDDAGRVVRVAGIAADVTERSRSETIQQKRFELMEFSTHHSLEEVARKTMDEVSELTGSELGFFHFMEDDEKTIAMQVWSSNALRLFNVPLGVGEHMPADQAGAWAEAVRQRRPLIQNDYESLPDKKGLPHGHAGIVREMLIPIIRNEKILAVMGIANKPGEYTQQDLEIAAQFTDYAWDVTERKGMEAALANERNLLAQRIEERTAELRASNANLARALRVKDEFLANMSHELRTPLNAVLGLSESLGEQVAGPLNEKQLRYVTTISESGHHLLSLINDILDLAKIEAGQVKLEINKVDVNLVCQAGLRMVKQMAQKKKQEVSLDIAPDLGLIWADERRLKQMIVNLLSNAVKFTPENGRIGLEIRGNAGDNTVMITVWDNGIGIKEADLVRLFQPFMQLDASLARESSGTGLGLALVAQMARLHGGGVQVESKPGQGSRFTIVLPWEPAAAMDPVERLRQTGKLGNGKAAPGRKAKILLVEDTREVVMLIQDYLEMEGYTVVAAQDGLDGIAQAKIEHPDLILMDLQMPRMDGLEATRRLRGEPGMKHIPIVAVTALAMPNDRERCLAAGMNEYITKPVNLKALVRTIQKCLSTAEEKTSPI